MYVCNSSSHDVREEDRMQQLRAATKLTTRPPTPMPTPNVQEEDNFVSHEAESFAQQECDVITARPIAQKVLSAFASINRRHAKLGSIFLRRMQLVANFLFPSCLTAFNGPLYNGSEAIKQMLWVSFKNC